MRDSTASQGRNLCFIGQSKTSSQLAGTPAGQRHWHTAAGLSHCEVFFFSLQRMGGGHNKEEGLPMQCPQWTRAQPISRGSTTDLQQSLATDLSLNNINGPMRVPESSPSSISAKETLPSLFSTQLTIYCFQFPQTQCIPTASSQHALRCAFHMCIQSGVALAIWGEFAENSK